MIYLLDANALIHLANRAEGSENIEMHIAKAGAGERNEWPDVLIAGQAAASGYTLVTDDVALLAMRGVTVENWR